MLGLMMVVNTYVDLSTLEFTDDGIKCCEERVQKNIECKFDENNDIKRTNTNKGEIGVEGVP